MINEVDADGNGTDLERDPPSKKTNFQSEQLKIEKKSRTQFRNGSGFRFQMVPEPPEPFVEPFWIRFSLKIGSEGIDMTSGVARREPRAFWEPSKATRRAHGAKSRLLGGGVAEMAGGGESGLRACVSRFSLER